MEVTRRKRELEVPWSMDPTREGVAVFGARRVARTDSLMQTLHLNVMVAVSSERKHAW